MAMRTTPSPQRAAVVLVAALVSTEPFLPSSAFVPSIPPTGTVPPPWILLDTRRHPLVATAAAASGSRAPVGEERGESLSEPEDEGVRFGRKDYWDGVYRESSKEIDGATEGGVGGREAEKNAGGDGGGGSFSWYCGWGDLEPFFTDVIPAGSAGTTRLLVPGIGNDAAMVDMYDAGWTNMTAFDYAPEGAECARKMFGPGRLEGEVGDEESGGGGSARLYVADARDLPFPDDSFDAVLEKGTLDAVYLSGGKDKDRARRHLSMAVSELARVVRPGGIIFSVTAACVDAVQETFGEGDQNGIWRQLRDGGFYITDDGYSSNNVDATMLVWQRL